MRSESIKLTGGVVALRTFTKRELVAFAKVKLTTASSWLTRHAQLFEARDMDPGGRGRPAKVYRLSPAGLDELLRRWDETSAARIEGALRPTATPEARRIDAVDLAALSRDAWEASDDPQQRDDHWQAFEAWLRAARRQVDGSREANSPIVEADVDRLRALEFWSQARAKSLSSSADVDVLHVEVLSAARDYIVALMSTNAVEARREGWARPVEAERPEEWRSLRLLAAMGVAEKMPANGIVGRCIHQELDAIGLGAQERGLRRLLGGRSRSIDAQIACVAVVAGVRLHAATAKSHGVAGILDQWVGSNSGSPVICAAYAKTRLNMPHVRLGDVAFAFAPIDAALAPMGEEGPILEISEGFEDDPTSSFRKALSDMVRDVVAYGRDVGRTHRGSTTTGATDIQRFNGVFAPSGWDT